jgi:predicted acetyltransferase
MDQLTVVAPSQELHQDELIELIAKTFGRYWSFRDYCRNGYLIGAPYDWEATRAGFLSDRIVSHFGVWDYQLRIGISRLRLAGIGAVATHRDHLKKGFMRKTIRASLAAQRSLGYDISLLFGIQNFYNKFGYRRVFADVTLSIPRRKLTKLEDFDESVSANAFVEMDVDVDRFAQLSNRRFQEVTGTFVRPNYTTNRRPDDWKALGWPATGTVEGYIIYHLDQGSLKVVDHAGEVAYVLAALRLGMEKTDAADVTFPGLPPRCPLGRAIRRGDADLTGRYVQQGGAMARIVNLRSCLEKLCPELSKRLSRSGFADWSGEIKIDYAGARTEQVCLGVDTGRVAVIPESSTAAVISGGDELVRLIYGSEDFDELIAMGDVASTTEAYGLGRALFPAQDPTLPVWDRF